MLARLGWQAGGFLLLAAIAWLVARLIHSRQPERFSRLGASVDRLTRSRGSTAALIFAAGLLLAAGPSVFLGLPQPEGHDQFCNLLIADTLASGRVSTPTPPCWEHFESFQILLRPSYAAKALPGPALALALGLITIGLPIAGVWLVTALVPAVGYWAFLAWCSPRWSLLGAGLLMLHPLTMAWGRDYYGVNFTVVGSLLVLGSLGRLLDRPRWSDGLMLGAGAVMLAVVRPWEGAVLVATALVSLAARMPRMEPRWRQALLRAAIAAAIVVSAGAGGLALYNKGVTGNALRMPYQEAAAQYQVAPPFIWQQPLPVPHYNHSLFAEFYANDDMVMYRLYQSHGFLSMTKWKVLKYAWTFIEGLLLGLPLLTLPWVVRRGTRLPILVLLIAAEGVALLPVTWNELRYFAAALGPIVLLPLLVCSRLRVVVPTPLVRRTTAVWAVFALLGFALIAVQDDIRAWQNGGLDPWPERRRIEAELSALPGRQLVIVRYLPGHHADREWVYNSANFDTAKILWAREMNPASDAQLTRCYPDRKTWLLIADEEPVRLRPYP